MEISLIVGSDIWDQSRFGSCLPHWQPTILCDYSAPRYKRDATHCANLTFENGEFSFNQYLIVDDAPLLFHTGPRRMFALLREAVASVLPVDTLRYVSFSHVEADECGSLNDWLAVAPGAVPLCGSVAALVSIDDMEIGRAHV